MQILKTLWRLFASTVAGLAILITSYLLFIFLIAFAAWQFTLAIAETLGEYYRFILRRKF